MSARKPPSLSTLPEQQQQSKMISAETSERRTRRKVNFLFRKYLRLRRGANLKMKLRVVPYLRMTVNSNTLVSRRIPIFFQFTLQLFAFSVMPNGEKNTGAPSLLAEKSRRK